MSQNPYKNKLQSNLECANIIRILLIIDSAFFFENNIEIILVLLMIEYRIYIGILVIFSQHFYETNINISFTFVND